MHPRANLKDLAGRKAALRARIAVHRERCAVAADRVAAPLKWLDRSLDLWRRIAPIATLVAAPLTGRLLRALFPRAPVLRSLLRWGPPVLAAVRGARSQRNGGAFVRGGARPHTFESRSRA